MRPGQKLVMNGFGVGGSQTSEYPSIKEYASNYGRTLDMGPHMITVDSTIKGSWKVCAHLLNPGMDNA